VKTDRVGLGFGVTLGVGVKDALGVTVGPLKEFCDVGVCVACPPKGTCVCVASLCPLNGLGEDAGRLVSDGIAVANGVGVSVPVKSVAMATDVGIWEPPLEGGNGLSRP
jgi:hypothetical protein